MAITQIQSSSARADNADKAPTCDWDNTPTAGDLLVCKIGWSESSGNASVSLTGWTPVPTDGDVNLSGKVRLGLFYKIAADGESNKVKASLNAARRWTMELVQAHSSTGGSGWQVDKSAHSSGTSTAPSSGTTTTTTTANEFWVAGFAAQNTATFSSPTNGFAIVEQQVPGSQDSAHVSGVLLTRIATTAATANTAGSYNKSRPWVGTVATFHVVIVTVTGGFTLTGTGSFTSSPYYSTPTLAVQAAFGYGPSDPDPVFTEISDYTRSCQWQRGRQNELNQTQAGTSTVVLNDPESHFDPNNSPSTDYPATEYAATVLEDSPRIWLRLDAASGTFTDSSGLGHTGTAVGGVTYAAPGAITGNTAVTLDGSTGYVTAADHADLDLGDVFTLECWVKRNALGSDHYLISKGTNGYGLFITAGSGVVQLCKCNSQALRNSSISILADGLWHHVVGVKDGATTRDIYIDGVLANGTDYGNATCANTAAALNIGREVSTNISFLNGSIDEVAVYPIALSAAQVKAHYRAGRGGSPFYPYVKPGLPVRAILFVGSSIYPLFYGYAERLPRTSRVTDVYTQRQLELVDGFALLANAGLGGMAYGEEQSNVRVSNVLDDIAWSTSARRIGTGVSTIQTIEFPDDDDTRAQNHLQAVSDSENGLLFCDGAGRLVFVGRHELIGDSDFTVSKAVFGDVESGSSLVGYGVGPYGGGGYGGGTGTPVYKYTDLLPSYDLDNVFNKWVITRLEGEPQVWEDAASQEDYFLRVKQQPSLVASDGEALNQAQWKSGIFSQPLNRVESITIMPLTDLNDPDRIAAGLGREVGDRITIKETPPGFSAQQSADYVIQHVSGQINTGPMVSAQLTFLLWPATTTAFWIIGDPDQSLAGVSTKPGY